MWLRVAETWDAGKGVQWDNDVSDRPIVVPLAKTGSTWRKTGLVGSEVGGVKRRG